MRVLLVSTYELGRQPVHLASPSAALAAAGVEVDTVDLAVEEWDPGRLEGVDRVAFSVPMHTAMRLAVPMAERVKELRPDLPVAFYGLYAGVGAPQDGSDVVDLRLVGEYEPGLVAWAQGKEAFVSLGAGRPSFHRPDRSHLPDHGSYARLEWEGEDHPRNRLDLNFLAHAKYCEGRSAEAAALFHRIGPHATPDPWSYPDRDPHHAFQAARDTALGSA